MHVLYLLVVQASRVLLSGTEAARALDDSMMITSHWCITNNRRCMEVSQLIAKCIKSTNDRARTGSLYRNQMVYETEWQALDSGTISTISDIPSTLPKHAALTLQLKHGTSLECAMPCSLHQAPNSALRTCSAAVLLLQTVVAKTSVDLLCLHSFSQAEGRAPGRCRLSPAVLGLHSMLRVAAVEFVGLQLMPSVTDGMHRVFPSQASTYGSSLQANIWMAPKLLGRVPRLNFKVRDKKHEVPLVSCVCESEGTIQHTAPCRMEHQISA